MKKLKTSYKEIVSVNHIGGFENPININELLDKAIKEDLTPAKSNQERVLLIGIDFQNDFITGSLPVEGAKKDIENFTKFIYNNMDKISEIDVSIDTHIPQQIFHPFWWIDENGNHPAPFTLITLNDIDNGKWKGFDPIKSREYLFNLEKNSKKTLCIWPYHCLQGTWGCALENQIANMIYFFNVAKKSIGQRIVKGQDPYSEMYGIIKPEYDTKNYINLDFLNKLSKFDKIIIGGEAKSHCVMESIRQILEYYENKQDVTSKVYILEDCMSAIGGFEDMTNDTFKNFKTKYNVNIVKSTDLKL